MTITSYQFPAVEVVSDAIEHIAQHGILGHHDPRIFDVGTEAFLRYFSSEILDDLLAQGGATCRFFEGSYGAGKTHLLRLLAAAAAERGMATVRTDLSQDLGLDDWRPITRTILSNIEVNFRRGTVRGFPDILDALRRRRAHEC